MRSTTTKMLTLTFALTLFCACGTPLFERFDLDDAQFNAQDNTPDDNPQTPAGIALGRVLFYDTLLSQNGAVSCASCHQQEHGFSDPVRLSEGFDGGLTGRNSMSLINVRFYEPGSMFWDERAATLEEQVLMPIFDPVEMGLDENELLARLQQSEYYAPLYAETFGDEQITLERTSRALAQFVRSIVSHQSKWDLAVEEAGTVNGDLALLTDQENQGKRLFFNGGRSSCAGCHLQDIDNNRRRDRDQDDGPIDLGFETNGAFSVLLMNQARHNGLSIENGDQGVFEATGDPDDIGKFKSPSLRNVELTGPFMHDGRFETLEEVVEHYNSGVVDHPNLDNRMRRRLNLNDAEKAALVAFMKTFTDTTLATNAAFSDPFAQ